MKDFSCYLISTYGEKKLSSLEVDVVYLYLVGDKLYFAWTKWMSYGLCFLEGWMLNHTWGNHELSQHINEGDPEEIWIQIWMQRWRFFPCDLNSNKEI